VAFAARRLRAQRSAGQQRRALSMSDPDNPFRATSKLSRTPMRRANNNVPVAVPVAPPMPRLEHKPEMSAHEPLANQENRRSGCEAIPGGAKLTRTPAKKAAVNRTAPAPPSEAMMERPRAPLDTLVQVEASLALSNSPLVDALELRQVEPVNVRVAFPLSLPFGARLGLRIGAKGR